jgi:hypothetical protein
MVAIAALVLTLAADAGAPAPSQALPACVNVTAEARYVPFGYNHVVIVRNGCSKVAACSVATDVNPQPQNVEIKAGETAEVTTFMGSPQQTFSPIVRCQLR